MEFEELGEPVPGELRREPIPDADVPCPRCGGRSWLLVEVAAEPEEDFTRWAAHVCAACGAGIGWHSGGRRRPGREVPDDPPDRFDEDLGVPELVAMADFPVYAPPGPPRLAGHGHEQDRLTSVTLEVDGLLVETGTWWCSAESAARGGLRTALLRGDDRSWMGRSAPARDLHMHHAMVRRAERAAAAPTREVQVEVDGVPVPFVVAELDDRWAAAAQIGDATVTITGPRELPARLVRVRAP